MHLSALNLEKLIEKVINDANFDARSSNILIKRFGLETPKTATLQQLGAKYGITRERVRQLEAQAVSQIRKGIESFEEAQTLKNFAEDHLSRVGGLRKDDTFMEELHIVAEANEDKGIFGNKARFIFKILKYPYFSGENDFFHSFWYVDKGAKNKMEIIHKDIVKELKKVEHFEEIFREAVKPHNIPESIAANYLSVSKKIGIGPYGDIGLSHWEEINPKTVRAKAFLLLKKTGDPMHFTEIAKFIDSHAPTVHNELIKDPRFVLMGRGTYGLKLK